jgi:hypothetical protein
MKATIKLPRDHYEVTLEHGEVHIFEAFADEATNRWNMECILKILGVTAVEDHLGWGAPVHHATLEAFLRVYNNG